MENKVIKSKMIKDIRHLFELQEEDYFKPGLIFIRSTDMGRIS